MIGFARLLFAAVACLAVFVRVEGAQAIRVAYCSEPGVSYNRAGEPRGGVVVDWMDRISRSLGRPVEWVDVTQSRAEEMLAAGEIDVIGGLIFKVARARRFHYFPHVTGQWKISLYVRSDPSGRSGSSRAKGIRRIGNVRSFPITDGIEAAMGRRSLACEIVEYDDVPQMEDALRAGEIDALLADLRTLVEEMRSMFAFKFRDLPVVAVTADADSSRTFDMSRFDLVLTKPVTGEKLKKSLADLFPRLFADAEKREE